METSPVAYNHKSQRLLNPFFFNASELNSLAEKLRSSYQTALPFPHIAIDGLIPEDILTEIVSEFSAPPSFAWKDKTHDHSKRKFTCNEEGYMGDTTRHVIAQLNSEVFLNFLTVLTGIPNLIPDPYLEGGGLHEIKSGGKLDIHADFNWHGVLKLDRRLNILLYLNKDWKDEYGGHLELWDKDMTHMVDRILPSFGRVALFSTSDTSYHGHPHPLSCPENITRKSIALYYYTNGRPAEEVSSPHSTIYKNIPGSQQMTFGKIIKQVTPPIIMDVARHVKKRVTQRKKS